MSMLSGLPQAGGKVLIGIVGATVLAASANTVALLAEAVRRAARQAYEKASGQSPESTFKSEWKLKFFTPYRHVEDWTTLGLYALTNLITGTIALYLANRFMPSLVINANSLLHKAVPIQFIPSLPLTKLAGL